MDESGTHDMSSVDPKWPVFALIGLLVGERYYAKTVVPRVKALKRKHGIPLDEPLHSRPIRRWEGCFRFLEDKRKREAFYEDINSLVSALRVRLYAAAIHKQRWSERFVIPLNPYDVSLNLLLNLSCGPVGLPSPWRPAVSRIVIEARGRKEDRQLQQEYQRLRQHGLSSYGTREVASRRPLTVTKVFPGRVEFARKSKVIAGLELADLCAYPIARAIVNDSWENPACRVVGAKLVDLVVLP
jgi:hypothetical protein